MTSCEMYMKLILECLPAGLELSYRWILNVFRDHLQWLEGWVIRRGLEWQNPYMKMWRFLQSVDSLSDEAPLTEGIKEGTPLKKLTAPRLSLPLWSNKQHSPWSMMAGCWHTHRRREVASIGKMWTNGHLFQSAVKVSGPCAFVQWCWIR